ncbi:UvrD-helicase domain-containing protein [Carboxylicivirga caseinilyticus]|uniref:UvrD-helicase domain-containing protein n=1 Tax=Carboxylicivirga caseinilyticus TaxID=3417572 RepID=UPI003D340772|nr:UvrD-helicase domain-containing protein [Marinilabiliaceae bacterium A049]
MNKLIIAAAGSGKTTHIVNDAINNSEEKILITTYTEQNEVEIKNKIIELQKCIPNNIVVQTWFSFLLQHGVEPYQGELNEILYDYDINGMLLVNQRSGFKCRTPQGPIYYSETKDFERHYFTIGQKIYSDKIAKFVYNCNKASDGAVIDRLEKVFNKIYIDEVQDLAGYDLEVIKLLLKSKSKVTMVGDPRQVTYLTHNEAKNGNYKDGRIKYFLLEKCKTLINGNIDETSLNVSHRNNKEICNFSSKLYPEFPTVPACECDECRSNPSNHEGVFFIEKTEVDEYLKTHNPVQLRWSSTTKINQSYKALNFGESKGKTFERILIYPTVDMSKWIKDNTHKLKNETRAKLYVAITRARRSVGIII